MFLYGKEEPVSNNDCLFDKKKFVNEHCTNLAQGRSLNRYSFLSDKENWASILIQKILKEINIQATIIVAWEHRPLGRSLVAGKVVEARLKKQGWTVHSRNNHFIAEKNIDPEVLVTWPTTMEGYLESDSLILFSEKPIATTTSCISHECSSFLAWYHQFAPDDFLYEQVEQGICSVLYKTSDSLGRVGLVFLSRKKLTHDFEKGLDISDVFEGEEAYKVFL